MATPTLIDTPRGVGGKINRNTTTADQAAQAGLPDNPALYGTATTTPTPLSGSITSQSLAPAPSFNLQAPKPATQTNGMLGYLDAFSQQAQSQAIQDKADYKDSLDTYMKAALSADTEGGFLEQVKADTGVQDLKKEDTAIATDIRNEQYALQKRIEALRKNPSGLFGGALEDAINEAETESLSKQADLYIKQLAINGKYKDALDFATNAAKAMFEKQEKRNEALKFNVEQNKDLFSASELRTFNLMQADRDRELDAQKQMKLFEWQEKIKQQDPMYQAQLLKAQNDAVTSAPGYNPFGPGGGSGDYGSIVSGAAGLVGAERGKTTQAAMQRAIGSGDYASAYALVANNVEESLTADNKAKFSNARTDYVILSNLRGTIQEFEAAGGNTGFLKGTADQIARRFGQLKTDPKFAALAVQLEREFQSYRQNMTGAAFSPAESREYASVNPRTSASIDLNLATIDGAMNQLENRITSTIETRVPGATKLYNQVSGKVDEKTLSDDDAYELYLKKLNGTQ